MNLEHDQMLHTQQPRRREMSDAERWKVYTALLEKSANGQLKRTTTTEISTLLSVPKYTVRSIWRRAKKTPAGQDVDVSHKRKAKCGRKKIQIDLTQLMNVPLQRRTTVRSVALAMNMAPTTMHRRIKEGKLRRHSNAIKPRLKEGNMKDRLQFCLSMVDMSNVSNPKFVDMYDVVHIDEKWFQMTKKKETYYLHPAEEELLQTCQSKNFIPKVMFLVAMARPRFDNEGNETFSGKIGLFPLVTMEAAKRRSKNREAGTMEMKPILSITRAEVKKFLIDKVLPAIREKWPVEDYGKTIWIQQDNAKTHVNPRDENFQAAASQFGFDIRLMCQPSNSPDLNILDLGFFSAIQSLQHKTCAKTVEEIVSAVEIAFEEYPTKQLNRIFLSLQSCMIEIMKVKGSNKYRIPHMKKGALEREGNLPIQLACDPNLVQDVMNILGS